MARYTAQQLSDLRASIAEGVLEVRFSDGRRLIYRSLSEMRRLEAIMSAELEQGKYSPQRISCSFKRI
jgi:hypothetical protein